MKNNNSFLRIVTHVNQNVRLDPPRIGRRINVDFDFLSFKTRFLSWRQVRRSERKVLCSDVLENFCMTLRELKFD